MPTPFSRTLNALKSDDPRRRLAWLWGGLLLLGAWLLWFFLAEVPVYEATPSAHLEVSSAAHPVDAPVEGRVIQVRLVLGQEVGAGEVLVALDAQAERLQLEEVRARVQALTTQREVSAQELKAEESADLDGQQGAIAAHEEAQARAREAEAAARLAEEDAARTARLVQSGAASPAEHERALSEARQRKAAAEALQRAASRAGWDTRIQKSDRRARVERLRREIAVLEGDLASYRAQADRLAYEVERRSIRAPVAGKVGEIATLRVGAVLRAGDRVASVVPAGDLKVVADYLPPAAIGRIRPGQPARVRLDGFPWTQYGSIPATVSSVASEARYGRIRVELFPLPDPGSKIPRQHGLTGTTEVQVERASPAALVLRAVGRQLSSLQGGAP